MSKIRSAFKSRSSDRLIARLPNTDQLGSDNPFIFAIAFTGLFLSQRFLLVVFLPFFYDNSTTSLASCCLAARRRISQTRNQFGPAIYRG
ncbi:hypothetical protein GO988_09660 [Hymenobacter sp. HMF4947]|uniref:Uncharacterized protein n=1 Tax=Hymenobacter ginkgonis TaxID=2682976 RepID=A0A7K1TDV9_9BACT|nr:hypothetical protein [Hymenobacter ginkgonis]MVN76588.1 hypothetical protein [Hymenobacter ginkgonis]